MSRKYVRKCIYTSTYTHTITLIPEVWRKCDFRSTQKYVWIFCIKITFIVEWCSLGGNLWYTEIFSFVQYNRATLIKLLKMAGYLPTEIDVGINLNAHLL